MGQLREIAHTADVGFEAEAESLEELFGLAALGLVRALGFPGGSVGERGNASGAEEDRIEELELEKPDRERLMVAWLRELLYRSMRDGAVPTVLELQLSEGDRGTDGGLRLAGRVAWRSAPSGGPVREIKGVTYHGLGVERRGGRWHARVVLDV